MNTIEAVQAWEQEYRRKGIPSSFRKDPSTTVVEFVAWLKRKKYIRKGLAVDVGCGLGRNSFYLASQGWKVVGIDLLEENVNAVNSEAVSNQLPVQAFGQSAVDCWPIEPNSLDIAIDVFCYKHIVCKELQEKYRKELYKSLKDDGFYFISLASDKDGFYGPLLEHSSNRAQKLVRDPHSDISSFLYSIDDLRREFSNLFEILEISEQVSKSPMYGKEYSRSVINAILKKREQMP